MNSPEFSANNHNFNQASINQVYADILQLTGSAAIERSQLDDERVIRLNPDEVTAAANIFAENNVPLVPHQIDLAFITSFPTLDGRQRNVVPGEDAITILLQGDQVCWSYGFAAKENQSISAARTIEIELKENLEQDALPNDSTAAQSRAAEPEGGYTGDWVRNLVKDLSEGHEDEDTTDYAEEVVSMMQDQMDKPDSNIQPNEWTALTMLMTYLKTNRNV